MVTQLLVGSSQVLISLGFTGFDLYIWKKNRLRENRYLVLLSLAIVLYVFGNSMELLGAAITDVGLDWLLFWIKVEYLGISFLPAFMVFTAVYYTKGGSLQARPWFWFLIGFSTVSLLMVWTNPIHKLHYEKSWIEHTGPFILLGFDRGPWYWVTVAYTQLAGLAGNAIFLYYWVFSSARYRHFYGILLAGSLFPLVVHIIYLSGVIPYPLDIATFSLSVSLAIYYWAVFRMDFIHLVPVARDSVFEWMLDPVLVLDVYNNVVDYNRSGYRLFFSRSPNRVPLKETNAYLEDRFAQVKLIMDSVKQSSLESEQVFDVTVDDRSYSCRAMALKDHHKTAVGRILVFHDVTSLITMSVELEKSNRALQLRNNTIEQELDMARLLQKRIFPQELPRLPGIELAAHYRSMDKVGGDFYTFHQGDDGLELFIADVSGHGIPGAFMASITNMAFHYHAGKQRSGEKLLAEINQAVCHASVKGMFVTALYACLETGTGLLRYANAGHYPLLIHRRAEGKRFIESTVRQRPLGFPTDPPYQEGSIQLVPGDRVVLYTDGIIEAENPQGMPFGVTAFRDFIRENASLGAAEFTDGLIHSLDSYHPDADFEDDITLLVLDFAGDSRFTPSNPGSTPQSAG